MIEVNIIKQEWTDSTRYTFTTPTGVVNVSVLHSLPNIAYISDFYVEEDYRGQGIGDMLFTYIMTYIKNTLKSEGVTLSCHIDNPIINYYISKWNFCKVADESDGYYLMFKKF